MANPLIIGGIVDLLSKGIDRIFPDKAEADKAKLRLIEAQQKGELDTLQVAMSAILAEANSKDPWTSRARPTFLYTIYVVILSAIPIGMLNIFSPESAAALAAGFKSWLNAVPDSLWALFGAGYLGYTGMRSWDKKNGMAR